MTVTFNEEQMQLIRQAMSNSQMKYLARAFKTEEELKELGREDRYLVDMEMEMHNKCTEIISIIDSMME